MPIHPLFGPMPYREPQSLMDVIMQQQAQSGALAAKRAQTGLTEARTRQIEQAATHPELNLAGLPAIARQRAYVASVKNAFGPDSQQAKEAQSDLDLTVHNLESQLHYRQQLAEFLPKRGLTAPSKAMVERAAIERGLSPTGQPYQPTKQIPTAPDQISPIRPKVQGTPLATPSLESNLAQKSKEDLINAQEAPFGSEDSAALSLYLSKQAGLGDNTKKLAYGSVLEKTLDLMKPYEAAMGYYSGLAGKAQLAKDVAMSQKTGKMTAQLKDYTKFAEMATSTLVPQITQYYGASVTEGQQKLLREVANPANWTKSPERALTAFDTLINTLENEIQVRRDLVTKPSFLTKKHAKTVPLAERLENTGYNLNEVVKKADKDNISPIDLINTLINMTKGNI